MKKIFLLLLTAALVFPYGVFAAGSSGTQVISRLPIAPNGRLTIFGVSGDWLNPDNCDRSSKLLFESAVDGVVSDTNATVSASIIAAKLKAAPVSFLMDGCILQSGFTYPRVITVILEN